MNKVVVYKTIEQNPYPYPFHIQCVYVCVGEINVNK